MAELQDYSGTAGSNNSNSPAGWPEGMAPSGLNDSDRELAARIARERDDTQGVTASTGSSNAYAYAAQRGTSAAFTGELICLRANFANTAAATINITPSGGSARGTKAIQKNGNALTGGEITANSVIMLVYDGTQYQMISHSADFDGIAETDGIVAVRDGSGWVGESGDTLRTSIAGDILPDLNTLGAASADGEFIVATGAGVFAYESGDTLRTSIAGDILPDLNTLGAASADGEFIVATGAGVFAYESGDTLRTSIGLGTGDTPQFARIGIGNSADSTIPFTLSGNVDGRVGGFINSHSSTPLGLAIEFSGSSPDDNTQYFFRMLDSTTNRCYIYSDGDLQNHDNAYGAISDRKLKQDITPARSQWDDVKRLAGMAVNFRFITDVEAKGDDAKVLLGLIAQDAEEVSPGLVRDNPDMEEGPLLEEDGTPRLDEDGNPVIGQRPTGETTKGLVFSVLYMKAVVALGEAMGRVEVLENRVEVLEAAA